MNPYNSECENNRKIIPHKKHHEDLKVILCLTIYRKTLTQVPATIEELRLVCLKSIISSWNIPLADKDFNLFFFDCDGEKCSIDTQEDLECTYNLARKAIPPWLKILVQVERGVNGEQSKEVIKYKRKLNEKFQHVESDFDSNSDDDKCFQEDYTFDIQECDTLDLIREGYQYYRKGGPFGNRTQKRHLVMIYKCSLHKCKGMWETQPFQFNGEYGRLLISHNAPREEHNLETEESLINKWCKSMLTGGTPSFEVIGRPHVRKLVHALSLHDPNLTATEVSLMIKKAFPRAQLFGKKKMDAMLSKARTKGIRHQDTPGRIEIKSVLTLRKTTFGRGFSFRLIDGKPSYFLYFCSDFQEEIAHQVREDPNLHLFIDGTFKCCPVIWNQLLNICVYHRVKRLYIPIAHVLMQSNKYEAYSTSLKWINNILNLSPKFLTCDFELGLIKATKEIYPDSQLVPCFFHFVKCLWTNASKTQLRKKQILPLTKQIIFSIKSLAFRKPLSVYRHFERIRKNFLQKVPESLKFFEYFQSTWMDGKFKIKDWNYYEKLNRFEELSITNNGLESFHQMIHSQMKRLKPSFLGFVSILARVETMKKAHFDQDKLNGDSQYNRCWPATMIFRELYSKTQQYEEEDKEIGSGDGKKEDNGVGLIEKKFKEPIKDVKEVAKDMRESENYFSMFVETSKTKEAWTAHSISMKESNISSNEGDLPKRNMYTDYDHLMNSTRSNIKLVKSKETLKSKLPISINEIIEDDSEAKRFINGDYSISRPLFFNKLIMQQQNQPEMEDKETERILRFIKSQIQNIPGSKKMFLDMIERTEAAKGAEKAKEVNTTKRGKKYEEKKYNRNDQRQKENSEQDNIRNKKVTDKIEGFKTKCSPVLDTTISEDSFSGEEENFGAEDASVSEQFSCKQVDPFAKNSEQLDTLVETISLPNDSSIPTPEIKVVLCYSIHRFVLPDTPATITGLFKTIEKNVISSWDIPITKNDYNIFFFHTDGDEIDIETQEDLQVAYNMAEKAVPKSLKVIIKITRGINGGDDEDKIKKRRRLNSDFKENNSDFDSNSEDEVFIEQFTFTKEECDKATIIREGYLYYSRNPYGEQAYYKKHMVSLFKCIEKDCTGRWETLPLFFNGEYGRLVVPHSLSKNAHVLHAKKSAAQKYTKALMLDASSTKTQINDEELLELVRMMVKQDSNQRVTDILLKIKKAFPNAPIHSRRKLCSIVAQERKKLLGRYEHPGSFDIKCLKTLRKTQFGQSKTFALIDNQARYFFFLCSDFQQSVAQEVIEDPNLHLFIDGTFKCCPRYWSQLVNICVLHRGKNLYMPIGHVLMQSNKEKAYEITLQWIKRFLKLNPKFITTDFELSLMNTAKKEYPNSQLVPCFFHLVKCLWTNAGKCGLRKRKILKLTKQLIFSLKALAFRKPGSVIRKFITIKDWYSTKGSCFVSFLEYFENTWIDGQFKIKDWNYYDKLQIFNDLSLTNNGLESFHQMIKSQLRKSTPSFAGFLSVLTKVEAMKKSHYDEDKINGDPQYNRCWPTTEILKQLYSSRQSEDPFPLSPSPSSTPSKTAKSLLKIENYFDMFCDLKAIKQNLTKMHSKSDKTNYTKTNEKSKKQFMKKISTAKEDYTQVVDKHGLPKSFEEAMENDEDFKRLVQGQFETNQLYFSERM
ncbi:unnamed protein product [Moneuplotes crassus]|uniref:MULE transposase domain-containing protein n=1 Tax=Euplotes crassus TaxID=5936 RepID=A0AAD1Y8I5_EUPCR|nr:unnamed protein product [Moneuplotes crassus]